MKPQDFLTRLARTEKLHDEFRTPAFYVVPAETSDEFLKRVNMTEEKLNDAISSFKNEHPKSIWEEEFEGVQVYHISTMDFDAVKIIKKYVRR